MIVVLQDTEKKFFMGGKLTMMIKPKIAVLIMIQVLLIWSWNLPGL